MKNTTYERPRAPDMLANGTPNIRVLRTSRARQGHTEPDVEEWQTEPVRRFRIRLAFHWWKVAICILVPLYMFICWVGVVVPWWSGIQDQWNYGSSRITQMDANVGPGEEEHFIAEYYKGAIIVIEIPFANPSAAHSYTISGLVTNNTTPIVQLSTMKDAKTGHVDLVVQVEGTGFQQVLYNTGAGFSEEAP